MTAKPPRRPFVRYFYDTLARYISLYVQPSDSILELQPQSSHLASRFSNYSAEHAVPPATNGDSTSRNDAATDYILLNGTIHYERDIQAFLVNLRRRCAPSTRLIIVYYNSLWKPLANLATALNLRSRTAEQNWISHPDVANLLTLADLEVVRTDSKILIPIYIPLVSTFMNRYIAPLPFFRLFTMINIVVARPVACPSGDVEPPSVSIVIPARNESGNIAAAIDRCPRMGPRDEVIFVEGNSTDDTWQQILAVKERYRGPIRIVTAQQQGRGKGDAVRLGFSLASNDILMILDADLTVPPEDLPKFYNALARGKGEFINGSRLVYPMEKEAMRFFNILGNKFFAIAFSFVLGQRFKDTLCGTKVLSRPHYEKIAANRAFFGDFDPFGDFDLLFGAARLGLKIVEVPVRYAARTYGTTNIQRWKHGMILLRMLSFAARKFTFR